MNVVQLAETVAKRLDSPDTWTSHYPAKNKQDVAVSSISPDACKWCAVGHCFKVAGRPGPVRYLQSVYLNHFKESMSADNDRRGREYVRDRILELVPLLKNLTKNKKPTPKLLNEVLCESQKLPSLLNEVTSLLRKPTTHKKDATTLKIKTFYHKVQIEAVQITSDNMKEVAEWAGGSVEDGNLFIKLPYYSNYQEEGYPGDYVIKLPLENVIAECEFKICGEEDLNQLRTTLNKNPRKK